MGAHEIKTEATPRMDAAAGSDPFNPTHYEVSCTCGWAFATDKAGDVHAEAIREHLLSVGE